MQCSLGISNFWKRSLVFLILLFSFISLHWSLRKPFFLFLLFFGTLHSNGKSCLSFSPLLFTSLLLTSICKAPSDNHFGFCISFSWGWSSFLYPVQCHVPPSIVHQALWLSDLTLKSFSHFHCIVIRDLIYVTPDWIGLVVFSTFFNFSLNLAIRSSWSDPQSAPGLAFADCIELLHLWLQSIKSIWFQYWQSADVHM